jgi:FOG: TPR repeat, SEL1 subfamily
MNIQVLQVVLDVLEHYGDQIIFDIERFEEALSEETDEYIDECYLVVLAVKSKVMEQFVFNKDEDIEKYIDTYSEKLNLSQRETLFMLSIIQKIIQARGYQFEIPFIDELLFQSRRLKDFHHLEILANCYLKGSMIKQDYEKAFELYSYLYHEKNHEESAYYLGYMYEFGLGIEADQEKALMYYHAYPSSLSEYRLGMIDLSHHDEMSAYTHFSLSEYKDSYYYRGLWLEKQRDYAGAFEAYYHGAGLYQKECLYKTGMFFKTGLGVKRDFQEAYDYLESAYFLFHGESAYELAMFYLDGLLEKKDVKKALDYLHQAASLLSQRACLLLSRYYHDGQYVQKDQQKASYYYQRAVSIQGSEGYENL